MPNREVITKWVEALESGDYVQTTGVLQRLDRYQDPQNNIDLAAGFCCLGVLCELAVKEGQVSDVSPKIYLTGDRVQRYGVNDTMPPWAVVEWAGLGAVDPAVKIGNRLARLTEHNDDYGATFAEIAQGLRDTYLDEDKEEVTATA